MQLSDDFLLLSCRRKKKSLSGAALTSLALNTGLGKKHFKKNYTGLGLAPHIHATLLGHGHCSLHFPISQWLKVFVLVFMNSI